jgi:hypothetical protein
MILSSVLASILLRTVTIGDPDIFRNSASFSYISRKAFLGVIVYVGGLCGAEMGTMDINCDNEPKTSIKL